MDHHLRALRRTCWVKSRNQSKLLCTVCYCYRSSYHFSTNYCCSPLSQHSTRHICDTCVHQHILSTLYSCLRASVSCPEFHCRAYLPSNVICHYLLKFDSHTLLDDYLREQQWQGKSEEWIKRFASHCPQCFVPIEKNGGCDEMLCIKCQTRFYWSKAKRYWDRTEKPVPSETPVIPPYMYRIVFLLICLLMIVFVLYRNRK